jgi:hypothetical protein
MDGLPQMSTDDMACWIALQDFAVVWLAVNPLKTNGEITAKGPRYLVAPQYTPLRRRIFVTVEQTIEITGLQRSHKFA